MIQSLYGACVSSTSCKINTRCVDYHRQEKEKEKEKENATKNAYAILHRKSASVEGYSWRSVGV